MVFHFPPISGGGVVVITELANALTQLGNDVTILAPDLKWDGEPYNPDIDPKIKIIKVEIPSKANLKIAARRCYPMIKKKGMALGEKENFDFILTIFHPFHLIPKAAISCGEKLKIPVLIKIDDALYGKSSGLKSIQRKIEKYYNSKTLQKASRVLVSNENTKKIVNEFYKVPSEKMSIVPNGVKLDSFFSRNKELKIIVFSGAMYFHRGLDILLESAREISNQVKDVKFLLLGSGPEMKKLEDIVKREKISSIIEFKGWIDRNKIPEFLSNASIGIGPLRSTEVTKNALPIKVLEYMASSLPIIAMENTLPDNILKDGENGFFVKNSFDLSKKIIELLKNDELRLKMSSKSKEMVSKFDWKNIVELIENNYNKCKVI